MVFHILCMTLFFYQTLSYADSYPGLEELNCSGCGHFFVASKICVQGSLGTGFLKRKCPGRMSKTISPLVWVKHQFYVQLVKAYEAKGRNTSKWSRPFVGFCLKP